MFRINHIHLKSPDPKALADWFVEAFKFTIVSDTVRVFGDRFIGCDSEDGMRVNISSARTGEADGAGRRGYALRARALRIRRGGTWTRKSNASRGLAPSWPTGLSPRTTAGRSPSSRPLTTFESS